MYLNFVDMGTTKSGLTKIWRVDSGSGVRDAVGLGVIQWYAPWRRYCFVPVANIVLDKMCLREIADFCENRTEEK